MQPSLALVTLEVQLHAAQARHACCAAKVRTCDTWVILTHTV